jgi:hypothetical protein
MIPKKLDSRAISDCVAMESSTRSSRLPTLLTRMLELRFYAGFAFRRICLFTYMAASAPLNMLSLVVPSSG